MVDVYIFDTREISTLHNCIIYVMNLFLDFIIVIFAYLCLIVFVYSYGAVSPDLARGQVSLQF